MSFLTSNSSHTLSPYTTKGKVNLARCVLISLSRQSICLEPQLSLLVGPINLITGSSRHDGRLVICVDNSPTRDAALQVINHHLKKQWSYYRPLRYSYIDTRFYHQQQLAVFDPIQETRYKPICIIRHSKFTVIGL